VISLIIDDIGYRLKEGKSIITIQAPLTYAVLPNAPYSQELANLAYQQGKEVILHMPMQSTLGKASEDNVLSLEMGKKATLDLLQKSFALVPYAIGMNNHQGSLLTRHPGGMAWVMAEMRKTGRFFVDSRTSSQSVAEKIAKEYDVPTLKRDVFLDHEISKASITAQFNRLISLALKKGHAVGIGHPHPETIEVINAMLPILEGLGISLVPISEQFKQSELKAAAVRKAQYANASYCHHRC